MNSNKEHYLVEFHCGPTESRLINHFTLGTEIRDCVCGSHLAVSIGKEQVNNNSA